jgi:hypothetical protein
VNASFRPKAGKNFLEKTRESRENRVSERLREVKKRSSAQGRQRVVRRRRGSSVDRLGGITSSIFVRPKKSFRASRRAVVRTRKILGLATPIAFRGIGRRRARRLVSSQSIRQKKRPLKRAGVKSNGAKLYIRFLAGGTRRVVNHPSNYKAKFHPGIPDSLPEISRMRIYGANLPFAERQVAFPAPSRWRRAIKSRGPLGPRLCVEGIRLALSSRSPLRLASTPPSGARLRTVA